MPGRVLEARYLRRDGQRHLIETPEQLFARVARAIAPAELLPEARDAGWYGLRAWIAQGFKITKRAGWPWHRTRMHGPERTARLRRAVAVATLWGPSVGGAATELVSLDT